MNNSISIGIFVLVWNERIMLPHFLSYYLPIADKIEIFDNGTTDDSIITEMSKLSENDRKKIIIHDISEVMGLTELNNVQNTLWKTEAEKYDIVVHVDCDEFIQSDIKNQSFLDCLKDFYNSNATFAKVMTYECILPWNREVCRTDDILDLASHGYPRAIFNKPCILKPSKFEEWNLTKGRHKWSPKGKTIEWKISPVMKHILSGNIESILTKKKKN